MRRIRKAAKLMNLEFGEIRNLGSTWFSTPAQFRLVSYFTLLSMTYISGEEFSEPERQEKVGTILWPEWHYGVLLLYGQCMAMNHLIVSKEINVVKLENLIDYGSGNTESIFNKIHIHVFHGEDMFSKFMFRDRRYDNLPLPYNDTSLIKFYCLNIALESRRKTHIEMVKMLNDVIKMKL